MQLQVNYLQGLIGLDIYPHSFQLQHRKPDLQLEVNSPALILELSQPNVQIDQRQQFDQLGYRNPVSMTRYYGQKGQSIVARGIDRRVSEGNRFADIHQPVSVGDLTAAREQIPRRRQLTVEALPKTPPDIYFMTKPVEVDLIEGGVKGVMQYGKVTVESRAGQVDVYLRQKPEVQFNFTGRAIDFAI